MRQLDADAVIAALPWSALIDALDTAFRDGGEVPLRHHHSVPVPGEPDATLLLMPAWQPGEYIGVKLVNVMPGNGARNLPAIHGVYLLSDGRTGEALALLDGATLTVRRTAAASALAARYLAPTNARTLLMVGAGALAPNLIAAHRCARPSIERVVVWARSLEKAGSLAQTVAIPGLEVVASDDLEAACGSADIISCATLSTEPLVQGRWLKPGTHVDLVGAFKPTMRETDDEVMRRARVFVDTREGATHEGGDIVQALDSGALSAERIEADLFDLCGGRHPGRGGDDAAITVFKSVGTALEDLAAAILAVRA